MHDGTLQVNALAPTLSPLLKGSGSTGDLSIRQAIDKVADLGFRFIQLNAAQAGLRPRELDHSARRDLVATLRRRELAVAGIDAWIPTGHFADSAKVDHAVGAVHGAIELAADLGRVPVSLLLPDDPAIVESIVERAAHHGVSLADHHVPPQLREAIGVGIDPAAYLSQNQDPAAAVHAGAARLVSARLSDLLSTGLRAPPGDRMEARLDVVSYRIALSVANYLRPVVADARQWPNPWTGLQQTRAVWER